LVIESESNLMIMSEEKIPEGRYDDFIGIYDDALSEKQCVELIQYFEDYPNKTSGGFYSNSFQRVIVNKEKKDSTDITLNFFNKSSASVTIREALTKGTKQYRKDYPACDIMSFWDIYSGYTN